MLYSTAHNLMVNIDGVRVLPEFNPSFSGPYGSSNSGESGTLWSTDPSSPRRWLIVYIDYVGVPSPIITNDNGTIFTLPRFNTYGLICHIWIPVSRNISVNINGGYALYIEEQIIKRRVLYVRSALLPFGSIGSNNSNIFMTKFTNNYGLNSIDITPYLVDNLAACTYLVYIQVLYQILYLEAYC